MQQMQLEARRRGIILNPMIMTFYQTDLAKAF